MAWLIHGENYIYGSGSYYSDDPPGGYTFFAENCISSDASTDDFERSRLCAKNVTARFKSVANSDFHLHNTDTVAQLNGQDLSNDTKFPFNKDIDGDEFVTTNSTFPSITLYKGWSVGSDFATRKVVFSVGSTADFKSSNISISSGVATFSVAQDGVNFGVGHHITCAGGDCYIIEKLSINYTSWQVANSDGSIPADVASPTPVLTATAAYASLSLALAGVASIFSDSLIDGNCQVDIACYNISDTTDVDNAFEADKARFLKIYTPTNTSTQCNSVQKFSGQWGDGYSLVSQYGLSIGVPYTKIDGLQVQALNYSGISFVNAEGSTVANCIVKGCADKGISFYNSDAGSNFIINNLVYDCSSDGIFVLSQNDLVDNNYYLYNNNTINCDRGVVVDATQTGLSTVVVIKNHLSQFNSTADYLVTHFNPDHLFIEKSISSDNTSKYPYDGVSPKDDTGPVSNSIIYANASNQANVQLRFNDYAGKDFRLYFSDMFKVNGAFDMTYDGYYPFNKDIDNDVRTLGNWNIGVDNFKNLAVDEVFFSVGKSISPLECLNPIVTIVDGMAYFTEPQSNMQLGIGDEVTYNSTSKCYLAYKVNHSVWRVVTAAGSKPADISGSVVESIMRPFNSLADALAGTPAKAVLSGQTLVTTINLACYRDGYRFNSNDPAATADSTAVTISGWTTDADKALKIYTPYDTSYQCNDKQRHSGVWASNYTLASDSSVEISGDYIEFSGIQVLGPAGAPAIQVTGSSNAVIRDNIVRGGTVGIAQDVDTGYVGASIISNIVYGCSESGIDANNINQAQYSNTVSKCSIGYKNNATPVLKNNIAYNNGTDFFSSDTSNMFYCLSEDETAGDSNSNRSLQTVYFVSQADKTEDFHLLRKDSSAINNGTDLSADPIYHFSTDINAETITEWAIGAHSPNFETKQIFYSVGTDAGSSHSIDSNKTNSLLIRVRGSVVTFLDRYKKVTVNNVTDRKEVPQVDDRTGIGNVVTYRTGQRKFYLKRKITESKWQVCDQYGEDIPDTAYDEVVTGIYRVFNSLGSALNGTNSGVKQLLGTSDLQAAKYNVMVACYADDIDSSEVSVIEWETSPFNTITVKVPFDIFQECNLSQRHNGIFPGSPNSRNAYCIQISVESPVVSISCDNIVIDGICIASQLLQWGVSIIEKSAVTISNCIIKDATYGIYDFEQVVNNNFLINNIVYDCVNGIAAGTKTVIYNNTVVNISSNAIENQSATRIVNTVCQGSTCFASNTNIFNCISSDPTAGTDRNNKRYTTLTYIDASNKDFHLAAAAALARRDAKSLIVDSLFPFNYDATNFIRGTFWDVGALEFSDFKPVYYSIGNDDSDFKVACSATIHNSIMSFSAPQTSESIGVGDEVTYASSMCYLKRKISTSKWIVCDELGEDVADSSGNLVSIKHVFLTPYAAFIGSAGFIGNTDLVTAGIQLNLPCYASDTWIGSSAILSDWTTDDDCNIRIYTPCDKSSECNKSQRHNGIWNDDTGGFKIVCSDGDAIAVIGVHYTTIDGLQVQAYSESGQVMNGISFTDCAECVATNNIAQGCNSNGIRVANQNVTANAYIVNNLCFGNQYAGILIDLTGVAQPQMVYAYSNTCAFNTYGVKFEKDDVVKTNSGVLSINNLCQDNSAEDFAEGALETYSYLVNNYCLSKDSTAGDFGGANNLINTTIEFADVDNNVFKLDCFKSDVAIDAGTDLSDDPKFPFLTDITGRNRYANLWDIGAFASTPAHGEAAIVKSDLKLKSSTNYDNDPNSHPTILYLRETGNTPSSITGKNIAELNVLLHTNEMYSIVVYVQAGVEFVGTIESGDRTKRNLVFETDPSDKAKGPAVLIAASGEALIGDSCIQELLTLKDLKMYMESDTSVVINDSTSLTTNIEMVNCILQVNEDTVVGTNNECKITVTNSLIIYKNISESTELYLSKNDVEDRAIENTLLITNFDAEVEFSTVPGSGATLDTAYNCLLWNFGSGEQSFNPLMTSVLPILSNPLFVEGDLIPAMPYTTADLMDSLFTLRYLSPCRATGKYTKDKVLEDIVGKKRRSETTIDVGPYAITAVSVTFNPDQIQSVFQDKLFYTENEDIADSYFTAMADKRIFKNLALKTQYSEDGNYEYARESKLFIELKGSSTDYELTIDKNNAKLIDIPAYYDDDLNTIVVQKIPELLGYLFNRVFEDGQYVFHFEEANFLLSIYISDTYNKGLSGHRNIVNNVRFGGQTVATV